MPFGFQIKRKKKILAIKESEIPIEKAPAKLRYEICREKDDDMVPIKGGKITKKQEIVFWKGAKPLPRAFFVNHIVKIESLVKGFGGRIKKKTEYIVRWNAYWSEALDKTNNKTPVFSQELSNLLLADDMIQHRNGVSRIQGFVLDSQFLKLIVIVFAIGIPFGILMDTILNLIPAQVVHWIP